ncbi:hypothetical protein Vc3S01_A0883 [Vibrio campbellii]|nr:hypothetical protein Vc3S01_A0883 [Vibrio campbellii]
MSVVLTIKQLDVPTKKSIAAQAQHKNILMTKTTNLQGLLCCWLTIEKVNGSFKIYTHLIEDKFGGDHPYARRV